MRCPSVRTAVSLALSLGLALPPCARAQDAPLRIIVVEGDGAINNLNSGVSKAPVVKVVDASGKPAARAPVTFILPSVGPGGTFANGNSTLTVPAGDDGVAFARGLRPNGIAGPYQIRVTASHGGNHAVVSINQINAAPAGHGSSRRKYAILGLAAGAAAGIGFALMGHGGSSPAAAPAAAAPPAPGPVAQAPGGTIIAPGSPIFGPPR